MLIRSTDVETILDKTLTTKQDLIDLILQHRVNVVDYDNIPQSMIIDDYLVDTDHLYNNISTAYQDLVASLQRTGEADASPQAYWDLAEKLLLRTVADCIASTQIDMRNNLFTITTSDV